MSMFRTQHPQNNNHAESELLWAGQATAEETPQGGAQQGEAPGKQEEGSGPWGQQRERWWRGGCRGGGGNNTGGENRATELLRPQQASAMDTAP